MSDRFDGDIRKKTCIVCKSKFSYHQPKDNFPCIDGVPALTVIQCPNEYCKNHLISTDPEKIDPNMVIQGKSVNDISEFKTAFNKNELTAVIILNNTVLDKLDQ